MIGYHEEPGANLIEITVEGKVTRAEFDEIAANLEDAIARHGSVRLLEEIRDFEGLEASAFWDDVKFSLRHINDVSRVAVVTEERWIDWLVRIAGPAVKAEIRAFTENEADAARAWLRET